MTVPQVDSGMLEPLRPARPLPVPAPGPVAESDSYALDETAAEPSAYVPAAGLADTGTRPERPRSRSDRPRGSAGHKSLLSIPDVEPGSLAHWRKPLIGLAVSTVLIVGLAALVPSLASILGVVLSAAGILLALGGMAVGTYIAFSEDFVYGFFFFVFPLYAAYYFISRWDEMKVPLAAVVAGLVLMSAGGWALERGGGGGEPDAEAAVSVAAPGLFPLAVLRRA